MFTRHETICGEDSYVYRRRCPPADGTSPSWRRAPRWRPLPPRWSSRPPGAGAGPAASLQTRAPSAVRRATRPCGGRERRGGWDRRPSSRWIIGGQVRERSARQLCQHGFIQLHQRPALHTLLFRRTAPGVAPCPRHNTHAHARIPAGRSASGAGGVSLRSGGADCSV